MVYIWIYVQTSRPSHHSFRMNKWLTCPSCQWKLQKVCEKLSHINRLIMMVDIQPNHQERMVKKHTTSSISLIKGMGEMLHKLAQVPKTEGLFSVGGIPCLSLTSSLHTADISFDMVEYIVHVSIEWLTFCVKFYFQYINIQKSWLLFCPCLDFSADPELISSPPSLRCCCSSVETELTGFTFCFDDQRFRTKSASAFTKDRGTESNACNCDIDGNWLGVVRLASSQIASLFFLKLQKTSSSTPKHRRSTTLTSAFYANANLYWLVQRTKKPPTESLLENPPFQPDLPKQKGRPTKGFKMGSHMIHVIHTKADPLRNLMKPDIACLWSRDIQSPSLNGVT